MVGRITISRVPLLLIVVIFFSGCATAYDKHGVYHKVRGGESIWKIAKYYHISVQDLAEWNNIQDPKDVDEGLKLYIPKDKGSEKLKYKKLPESRSEHIEPAIKFDRSRFVWPVSGEISSPFGVRNGRRHDGIDIRAKSGTSIKAADTGKVVYSGHLSGYGNLLILKHKDHFFTVYAHNSKNKVKKGQRVAKGETIGYVGSTGRATGSHLHFEVRKGQKARNPGFFLPAVGNQSVMVAGRRKTEGREQKSEDRSQEMEGRRRNVDEDIGKELNYRKDMMEKLRAKKKR